MPAPPSEVPMRRHFPSARALWTVMSAGIWSMSWS
jgi:hypothetical protein